MVDGESIPFQWTPKKGLAEIGDEPGEKMRTLLSDAPELLVELSEESVQQHEALDRPVVVTIEYSIIDVALCIGKGEKGTRFVLPTVNHGRMWMPCCEYTLVTWDLLYVYPLSDSRTIVSSGEWVDHVT